MRFISNLPNNFSIFFILVLSILIFRHESRLVKLDAEIGWFEGAPDGVTRQILGVDGDFPRILRVNARDKVEYTITNTIENDYTDIHFHGLFQRGTVISDGASGMTQCAPMEGQNYVYKFNTAKQTGTFWYHSHFPFQQIDGLKGAFIIDDSNENPYIKPFNYYLSKKYCKHSTDHFLDSLFYVDHSICDGEADSVILLTDWYHKLAKDVLKDVQDSKPGATLTPDSALINGRGDYLCKSTPCKPMYDTKIILGKSKRIRIINAASMSPMHFAIQSHKLYVIECDGVYLDGKAEVEILRLNIGQRCSVIVKANKDPGNYWIKASMDRTKLLGRPSQNWKPEVYGVLAYADSKCRRFTSNDPSFEDYHSLDKLFEDSIAQGSINIDNNVNFRPHPKFYNPPPKKVDRTFEIKMSIIRDGNQILHTFNDIYLIIP